MAAGGSFLDAFMTGSFRRVLLVRLIAAIVVLGGYTSSAGSKTFMLLVNANNAYSGKQATMITQIRRMYLKLQTRWPNSEKVLPLGRPDESDAHAAFAWVVLAMNRNEIDTHWLRLKQKSGKGPPYKVTSVRNLLRQVAKNAGAFGTIEQGEVRKLPAKVRVLFKFSHE